MAATAFLHPAHVIQRDCHIPATALSFSAAFWYDKGKTFREELVSDPDRELNFNTVMIIYHLLYYSKPTAKVSGSMVPFQDVKRAAPFEKAFKRTALDAMAVAFDGRAEELRKACQALGGTPVSKGDVGYWIPAWRVSKIHFATIEEKQVPKVPAFLRENYTIYKSGDCGILN